MTLSPPEFEHIEGKPHFHGVPVERRVHEVAGRMYTLAGVRDAADLLDRDEFARRFIEEDAAPYGMELWPASHMLGEHLAAMAPGAGRAALDLGCGLGLVSLVAAACGWRVTACDNDVSSLQFALHNAALNDLRVESFEVVNWHHPPRGRRFECILAADVLYQLVDHAPILAFVAECLAPGGTAIISDPNRGVADRVPTMAASHGFDVETTISAGTNHAGDRVEGRIFTLTRAG